MQIDSIRIAGCSQAPVSRILNRFLQTPNSGAERFTTGHTEGEARKFRGASTGSTPYLESLALLRHTLRITAPVQSEEN